MLLDRCEVSELLHGTLRSQSYCLQDFKIYPTWEEIWKFRSWSHSNLPWDFRSSPRQPLGCLLNFCRNQSCLGKWEFTFESMMEAFWSSEMPLKSLNGTSQRSYLLSSFTSAHLLTGLQGSNQNLVILSFKSFWWLESCHSRSPAFESAFVYIGCLQNRSFQSL